MTIAVDIADRLYDYADEEKAAEAIADFQTNVGLNDAAILALWVSQEDPLREKLETAIFDAVDANGTVKRAQQSTPCGITLSIKDECD